MHDSLELQRARKAGPFLHPRSQLESPPTLPALSWRGRRGGGIISLICYFAFPLPDSLCSASSLQARPEAFREQRNMKRV